MSVRVSVGLYRHFKGQYYYVTGLSKSATDEKTVMVNYFNVCHPEYGSFVRPLDDFITTHDCTNDEKLVSDSMFIKDRPDNVTGQSERFRRVTDLNFQVADMPTSELLYELSKRKDSPLYGLDTVKSLSDSIFSSDYVVGEFYEATEDTPKGVATTSVHDTEEEAKKYLSTHKHRKNTGVFKRTFIEV